MSAFETLAALLTLTAAFGYLNHRWIRLPASIAMMAMTLALSFVLLALDRFDVLDMVPVRAMLAGVNFNETLLHGMLGALLFAGALHIRIDELRDQMLAVSILALVGTLFSTFIVAALAYLTLTVLGLSIPFRYCLLFGAVISPTDPIAVLGILKQARVPGGMEVQISGESLFNDGVGVVIFTTVLGVIASGHASASATLVLFARETLGGAAFGFASGYAVYRLLKTIDHYETELLLTLALVLGGYALAEHIHVSAPISAVVAGLLIGNQGRTRGMSDLTRDHLDKFWSLVDGILNAVLFVLVGLEVIRLDLTVGTVIAGALMIPAVLLARFVSVALPISAMARRTKFPRGTIPILTWGGLRGGISVALALSAPDGHEKSLIVTMTYCVVAFSILAQGLTLGRLVRRFGEGAIDRIDRISAH